MLSVNSARTKIISVTFIISCSFVCFRWNDLYLITDYNSNTFANGNDRGVSENSVHNHLQTLPSGSWINSPWDLQCRRTEFSCFRSGNSDFINNSFAFSFRKTLNHAIKLENTTFVGDSFTRGIYLTMLCYVKALNLTTETVKHKFPCEGTSCTWEHGVQMTKVQRPDKPAFFLVYIWAPFLLRVNVKENFQKDSDSERILMLDKNTFLSPVVFALLAETIRDYGGMCLIFAEMHWFYDVYTIFSESQWRWMKPSTDPFFFLETKVRAREAALRAVASLNTTVIELVTNASEPLFKQTYVIPESVLDTPTPSFTNKHWCTEMVSWAVLKGVSLVVEN